MGALLKSMILFAAALLAAAPACAQTAAAVAHDAVVKVVAPDASGYGGQVALAIGGSRILKFARPVGRVMLGDPKIADIAPLSATSVYLLGKASGATSLTVFGPHSAEPMAALDVRVGFDFEGLRRAIHDALPDEGLTVAANGDGIVIAGVASSSAVAAQAQKLAEQYAPGKVANLARVRRAEEVMLKVEVAEVQRSVLKQLGVTNFNALLDQTGSLALTPPALDPNVVANLFGRASLDNGKIKIDQLLTAMEQHGTATLLASPTLTALSGETAVFFAGGEFPVPVPQIGGAAGTNLITIEYKQYGVSVGFTPTVDGDSINVVVAPEVSELDKQNGVTLQGFVVPGITTRRAKTTVELRDGQSFAIAGLIQRSFSNTLRGLPGLMNIPIFGALARSTAFQNGETEVVIIVTAHLAQPVQRNKLLLPTDTRAGPDEASQLLFGKMERPVEAPRASVGTSP